VGVQALGGELYSLAEARYTGKRMDTGHPLAMVGRELQGKDKAEVTTAFSLLPTVQPHLPVKGFPLHSIQETQSLSPLQLGSTESQPALQRVLW